MDLRLLQQERDRRDRAHRPILRPLDRPRPAHRLLPELPLSYKDHRTQLIHRHPVTHSNTSRIHPPARQRQTCDSAGAHGVLSTEVKTIMMNVTSSEVGVYPITITVGVRYRHIRIIDTPSITQRFSCAHPHRKQLASHRQGVEPYTTTTARNQIFHAGTGTPDYPNRAASGTTPNTCARTS